MGVMVDYGRVWRGNGDRLGNRQQPTAQLLAGRAEIQHPFIQLRLFLAGGIGLVFEVLHDEAAQGGVAFAIDGRQFGLLCGEHALELLHFGHRRGRLELRDGGFDLRSHGLAPFLGVVHHVLQRGASPRHGIELLVEVEGPRELAPIAERDGRARGRVEAVAVIRDPGAAGGGGAQLEARLADAGQPQTAQERRGCLRHDLDRIAPAVQLGLHQGQLLGGDQKLLDGFGQDGGIEHRHLGAGDRRREGQQEQGFFHWVCLQVHSLIRRARWVGCTKTPSS
jgi:hypothetical protein